MIRKGFKYPVRYVRHKSTTNGQKITEFQIGSKVKNGDEYWNIRVTVWGGLDIADGDKIVLDKIQSIEARSHEGKVYFDMTAFAHPDGEQTKPPIDDSKVKIPFDLD